jgi:hypothetical protein
MGTDVLYCYYSCRQLFGMFGGDVMCAVARGTVHGVTDDEPRSTRIKQGLYPASSQENH